MHLSPSPDRLSSIVNMLMFEEGDLGCRYGKYLGFEVANCVVDVQRVPNRPQSLVKCKSQRGRRSYLSISDWAAVLLCERPSPFST